MLIMIKTIFVLTYLNCLRKAKYKNKNKQTNKQTNKTNTKKPFYC